MKLVTMQSKSLDFDHKTINNTKHNKSYDFVKYYKPALDSTVLSKEKRKSDISETILRTPTTQSKNKKKYNNDSLDMTINIDENTINHSSGSPTSNESKLKVTSTPKSDKKNTKNVVPIIKKSSTDSSMNELTTDISIKPKKRNKSVSFMVDDNEEVIVKKYKSDDAFPVQKVKKDSKNEFKKNKSKPQAGKENEDQRENEKFDKNKTGRKANKFSIKKDINKSSEPLDAPADNNKKNKRPKKSKPVINNGEEIKQNESTNEEVRDTQTKKLKKKKRRAKPIQEIEGESIPANKLRKKELKPDIEEGLQNLNIGDNAHTLTDLLDKISVVDKNKNRKRNKKKTHNKQPNEVPEEEKPIEEKEKVKWLKRKWNKDRKGILKEDRLLTSIIVENLPLSIVMNYRKLIAEHFAKFGVVQQVGVAELYPTEDPKPVFTTTVYFDSEDATTKSLEEDNTLFEGNRIRVKRPLSPTLTTVVVRSYSELTEQGLCSVFISAGRIRNIRHLVKGKNSSSTAFIEFDGPKAVERALQLAADAKLGGKKLHVSKFEIRTNTHRTAKKSENDINKES